jgi:Zn-dependent M28 family amino/carboxypeptidase
MSNDDLVLLLEKVSETRIKSHIQQLEGVRHWQSNPEGLTRAENYILASFEKMGYQTILQPIVENEIEYHNVLVKKISNRFSERWIFIIAHFDTEIDSPGADDNASGVAVMLEIANILRNVFLDRSIMFAAVNLEENCYFGDQKDSLRGSRILVDFIKQQDWQVEAVLNLETIGIAGDEILQKAPEGIPIQFPEKGDFIFIIGSQASTKLVDTFQKVIRDNHITLPCFPIVVPGKGEVLPDSRRSDHAHFWDADIPAVMITDSANFRSPLYHTPGDKLESLNIPFTSNVCRAALGVVVELAKGT